ncbi:MAG: hypothetical protein JO006_16885 [Paucibacter sp.]|nr:hypothetical protein [Roseateles sp.]
MLVGLSTLEMAVAFALFTGFGVVSAQETSEFGFRPLDIQGGNNWEFKQEQIRGIRVTVNREISEKEAFQERICLSTEGSGAAPVCDVRNIVVTADQGKCVRKAMAADGLARFPVRAADYVPSAGEYRFKDCGV